MTLPSSTRNMSAQQLAAHDAILARTRAALGPDRFEAEVRRGGELAPTTAVDEALAYVRQAIRRFDDHEGPLITTTEPDSHVTLTGRQHEVLRLLVAGLGNREIAARLGISTKTAMHHTTAIYRTLGVRGRSEAIAPRTPHGPRRMRAAHRAAIRFAAWLRPVVLAGRGRGRGDAGRARLCLEGDARHHRRRPGRKAGLGRRVQPGRLPAPAQRRVRDRRGPWLRPGSGCDRRCPSSRRAATLALRGRRLRAAPVGGASTSRSATRSST